MSVLLWCLLCRSVAEPQRDLGAQASLSRTRSSDRKVVAESLIDDARMATPPLGAAENRETSPLVADSRVASSPCAVEAGEGVLLGTSECRPPHELLTWTPSAPDLVGLTTWSRTSLKLTRRQEVQGRLAHRYPILPLRARDYRDGKLTGMTPLGRMISSRTARICGPCGPAL
jgi:hypothetical protein